MNQWNFLVVLRPTRVEMISGGPTDVESAAVRAHFAYFSRLETENRLLLAGLTTGDADRTMGIGIVSAATLEEAERIVELDPAVQAGVMSVEVQPFSIALFNKNASE